MKLTQLSKGATCLNIQDLLSLFLFRPEKISLSMRWFFDSKVIQVYSFFIMDENKRQEKECQ